MVSNKRGRAALAFVGVLAMLTSGCALNHRRAAARPVQYYCHVNLSRTKGMAKRHFASRITYRSNYVQTPKYSMNGALPPGLSFDANSGVISGTPASAGFWQVQVRVADRNKGIPGHGPETGWAYYQNVEIAIYDKLEE